MIEQRIQDLFREAVFKTAVQGTRCGTRGDSSDGDSSDNLYCLYTNDAGQHCAVGHALTPELQELVGDTKAGVLDINSVVQHHLGMNLTKDYHDDPHQRLWAELQAIHDALVDGCRKDEYYNPYHRPFGVSWSAWFWCCARSLSQGLGFDIGSYPRAEVRNAQAA